MFLSLSLETSVRPRFASVNGLMERDAMIADLQRQVRELQQQNNVRGPPPRTPIVPAAMGNSGVLEAAGSTEAIPGAIPEGFWVAE